MEELYQYDEEYRDSIGTVDAEGKRVWVYPKKPKGLYHKYRIIVTVFLLALLFSGPFIKIGGQPVLLLNIFERRFIILGQAFWPQDFFLLALMLVTLFVFIILFTVVFGRIWCGWICPQTLFMEMVYRKIEYWIEGDANQQRKLNKASWTTEKVLKKSFKQFLFLLIAILIAHTVMAYLIGINQVIEIVSQSPLNHLSGFIGLTFFTGLFYWVFAWFREQACIVVCPYGRLQGVLLVKNSITVAYDWLRGEPRGKLKKNQKTDHQGDCIDCKLCVHVCPTNIDIRNGTQLECVNCTACIDACDEVMVKVGKPKGLIRYASYNSIQEGTLELMNPRVIGYSVVLVVLVTLLSFFVIGRSDIETTILKVPGTLYQQTDDGDISNLYNIQFLNKTFEEQTLTVRIANNSDASIHKVGEDVIRIKPNDIYKGVFFITIPKDKITSTKTTLNLEIYSNTVLIDRQKTKFLGPVTSLKHNGYELGS